MEVTYKKKDFLPEYTKETSYNLTKVNYCCEKFIQGESKGLFAFGGYPEYPNTVAGKYFIFHTKHWDDDESTEEFGIDHCPFCGEKIEYKEEPFILFEDKKVGIIFFILTAIFLIETIGG